MVAIEVIKAEEPTFGANLLGATLLEKDTFQS